MIRYIALLNFKADAPADRIQQLMDGAPAILKGVDFKWAFGRNAGLPGSNADLLFMAEFADADAIAAWAVPAPEHKKIQELMSGLIEKGSIIHVPA